jgi:hypothetical protein
MRYGRCSSSHSLHLHYMYWVINFTPRHLRPQGINSSAPTEDEAGWALEPGWTFFWKGESFVPSENRTTIVGASSPQHILCTVYDIPEYVCCLFNDTHNYPYPVASARNIHIVADKFFYYSGSCRHIAMALWIKCLPDSSSSSSSMGFQNAEVSF